MHFVNRQCRFMNAFERVLGGYVKQETDDHILTACLTAWATTSGSARALRVRKQPEPVNVDAIVRQLAEDPDRNRHIFGRVILD